MQQKLISAIRDLEAALELVKMECKKVRELAAPVGIKKSPSNRAIVLAALKAKRWATIQKGIERQRVKDAEHSAVDKDKKL